MKEILKLDLDNAEFLAKADKARVLIQKIGDSKNLDGLISGLAKAAPHLAAIGAAVYGVKAAMDAVFEAEQIKAVNQQFEVLTKNAGIAGDALKESLTKAANGLIDDTELMKLANRSIVEMGASAKKLPELMDLARKATAAMGGELAANFETINHAIASGQTRALKNLGIIIDQEKAYKDYAKSIGVAADELTEAGKRQAIMGAALEKSQTAFKGINPDIHESTNTMKQLMVTIAQLKEVFILAFEKVAGPTVRRFLTGLREMATDFKRVVVAEMGEGAESAAAKVEVLERKLLSLKGELVDLDQKKLKGLDFDPGMTQAKITALTQQVTQYADELTKARAEAEKFKKPEETGPTGAPAVDEEANAEKRLERERKLQDELMRMREQTAAQELQLATSVDEVDAAFEEKRAAMHEAAYAREQELLAEGQRLNIDNSERIIEVYSQMFNQLELMEDDLLAKREAALDRYVRKSESVADGIARAFQAGATKNKLAMQDFGKRGEQVFDSFSKHSTDALLAMGGGTKSATDAMKGMFLNLIADRAQSEGSMLMLSGLWPPNPVALGAGAGLIALAGFLRSKAGGGGGGESAPSGGGGAGAASAPTREATSAAIEAKPELQEARTQRSVNLQIMGNYLDTDESRRYLMETMRKEMDATDIKLIQVGQ